MVTGLTSQEAGARLKQDGPNILPEKPPPSSFLILLDQFKSPLVYVLLLAALVTLFLRDLPDTAIILVAVFLNTLLGFYQERKAKRALYALKKILVPQAKVIRDGEAKILDARQIVPGDLVVLETGDKIPADGVLIKATDLSINEAILTGESAPVAKKARDACFMATLVSSGRGLMEVQKTGRSTRVGEIAQRLGEKEERTPLEQRLASLAKNLAILVGGLILLIFLSGVILGKNPLEMFTTAVALAVAAIPEGLVVSFTVVLAIGMQRILKRKALVRNLVSAETLGGVTTICADKTGTLTEGKMRVVKDEFLDQDLGMRAAVLCNNLHDPLEYAMWEYVKEQGEDPQKIFEENPRLGEIPFSSQYKFIATLHQASLPLKPTGSPVKSAGAGQALQPGVIFVSGAPELLLSWSKMGEKEREAWEKKLEDFGKQGFRLVGFALAKGGDLKKEFDQLKSAKSAENLQFLGLLLFDDPVRPEVAGVLGECRQAGIKVKVVTGDYLATSLAVLTKLGLKIKENQVMEGEELAKISLEELKKRIGEIVLFARTDPFQKLKIIQALKEKGEIVAMIGDGVNDAPALQRADIGVVVAEASEVAKETADMVLLDSDFQTIEAAVEEGRGIFDNLRKIILYLLADAFGGIFIIFGALVLGWPLPLLAGQILWINLISDGFPALALTVDPKREGIMREKPVNPKEDLLNLEIKTLIFLVSFFAGFSTLLIFFFFLNQTGDLVYSRSLAFALLGTSSLFYVFSCRSLRQPVWQTDFFANLWLIFGVGAGFLLLISAFWLPPLVFLLGTVPLGIFEWGMVVAMGLVVVLLIEGAKFIFMLKSSQTR